jgi:CBS domain containing-hemolysin-like protein
MSLSNSLLVIALLIVTSAFFSAAEIAMASARRLKLRQLAEEGERRAAAVLAVQEQPGRYFTSVQVALNTIAILGGIVGEGALTPSFEALFSHAMGPEAAARAGFIASFASIAAAFVIFADLFPRQIAMTEPERLAMAVVGPMRLVTLVLTPVVVLLGGVTTALIRLLGLPVKRDERITHDDILALAEAGTEAGVVGAQEQQVIANVFELDTRTVESAMTSRERIVYLLQDDTEETIRARIAAEPHSTYVVCDETIDQVVGYVDSADLFQRVLQEQPIGLTGEAAQGLLHKVLIVPDRLTLSEMLDQFRQAHEDFAVIVNEYSLVVGVITLNDVMSTVMGSLVAPHAEEQIVRRDDGSWLIDGITPIVDVMRAVGLDELPHRGQYDTLAGFLMVMLRRIPRRTDRVEVGGCRFEVLDVDAYRIDQVMVTRLEVPADGEGGR